MVPSKHDLDYDEPKGQMAALRGDENVPMQRSEIDNKLSMTSCGSCCDTRRTVIVVNIISLSFGALAMLSIAMITSDKYALLFDDEAELAEWNEIDDRAVGITFGFAGLGITCNALGIYGATRLNHWAVIIAGSWYVVEFLRALVYLDLACVIMSGLFAYPHVVFWQEMRKGEMKPINSTQKGHCFNF